MHLGAITANLSSTIIYSQTGMFQLHRKLRNLPNLQKCVNTAVPLKQCKFYCVEDYEKL